MKYFRVMQIIASIAPLLLIVGCQKNSFESCVEFQTAAATRAHPQYTTVHKNLQETIDMFVTMNCKVAP
jgi:hypothetical protein